VNGVKAAGSPAQQRFLHSGGAVREQDEADADLRADTHRRACGEPLDVDNVGAVADGQVHVLVGGLVEVLQERQRRLAQCDAARGEGGDLPQAQSDVVAAGFVALQRAPCGQRRGEAVRGGQGQVGAAGDVGECQRRVRLIECRQDVEQPAGG